MSTTRKGTQRSQGRLWRGPEFIKAMLRDPQAIYPGQRRMVQYHFTDAEIEAVVAFLQWISGMVTGTRDRAWPRERYDNLWLTAGYLSVEGASHWGLVLQRRALSATIPAVFCWIVQQT